MQPRRLRSLLVCELAALAVAASFCAHGQDAGNGGKAGNVREGYSAVQALEIVDCLLPGQVRVVGGRTYLTPRRPTRTTAADCGARGGEYLAYDRADYRSALNVWLPTAQRGDAKAQTMVGEIFERGLGGQPDYQAAAEWYRKAADQGYSQAQFDLGALYEQGRGVPKNKLEAL
ncbi:MAG TPA: tetratricopeptide repeat protein, partial [Gammaproteobacteria bacterium]|nr:tetratricopeptide repeat protein [Gammaproteobacteria bacterium]